MSKKLFNMNILHPNFALEMNGSAILQVYHIFGPVLIRRDTRITPFHCLEWGQPHLLTHAVRMAVLVFTYGRVVSCPSMEDGKLKKS